MLNALYISSALYIGPGANLSGWGQVLFSLGVVALLIIVLRSKGGG